MTMAMAAAWRQGIAEKGMADRDDSWRSAARVERAVGRGEGRWVRGAVRAGSCRVGEPAGATGWRPRTDGQGAGGWAKRETGKADRSRAELLVLVAVRVADGVSRHGERAWRKAAGISSRNGQVSGVRVWTMLVDWYDR